MVGTHIARELIEENRDVVIIEKDPEIARRVDNELDCLVINEDGCRPETLSLARAGEADWFIALTGSDAVNIVACGLVAAESTRIRTIARVETPVYYSLSDAQKQAFGLDILIHPAMEAARALSRIIEEGFAEAVAPLHGGALQLRTVDAVEVTPFIGKTLIELRADLSEHFLVAAAVRDGRILVPKGDFKVATNDRLYFLGRPEALDLILGEVDGLENEARRILIDGSTRVAERLIDLIHNGSALGEKGLKARINRFFRRRIDITVILDTEEEGKRLARNNQDIQILLGSLAEEGLLESASVDIADLFVAATPSQEHNIMTAQLAKTLGAKKAVAVTENHRFHPLLPTLAVDSFICSPDAVVSAVLEIVRKAHIRTIYSFYEDDVEIVELRIDASSDVAGHTLRDIELPSDVLIAFVQKAGELVVPSGVTVLSAGDMIGLVCGKSQIGALESIFGGRDGV
jgi:trk system potassium uptake protein TrkA